MKKVILTLLAVQIEYHWWQIQRLKQASTTSYKLDFHRLCADQLQLRYQVLAGICNVFGEIYQ